MKREIKWFTCVVALGLTIQGCSSDDDETIQNEMSIHHEYVDLGLSVKWATCNVGASSPSDYGNYFAWGETTTKSSYTESNSITYNIRMGDIAGNADYDAATANWGNTWRLPTKDEIDELINNCEWTWTTQDGHNGYEVTGPSSNSIFLPAAGTRGTSLSDTGDGGYYWSSSPINLGSYSSDAYLLVFKDPIFVRLWNDRYVGYSVRPVTE
ncbi:MAG: DUF1566 domain-containing protein [Porphyromonadaceae bacterium]|nr:DUF1566 domain-containing protein [Porphyromonadaceae bacterium]